MGIAIRDLKSYAFPQRRGPQGYFAMATGEDCIKQNVQQIVGTPIGSRPMTPTFGCRVHSYLFDPTDETMRARMDGDIRDALALWEPRVEVISVTLDKDASNPHAARYTVSYRVKATGQIDSFTDDLPKRP